jgi:hypothetical protein
VVEDIEDAAEERLMNKDQEFVEAMRDAVTEMCEEREATARARGFERRIDEMEVKWRKLEDKMRRSGQSLE